MPILKMNQMYKIGKKTGKVVDMTNTDNDYDLAEMVWIRWGARTVSKRSEYMWLKDMVKALEIKEEGVKDEV